MPIAEQTGLIAPLTSYVLDAALAQVRAWKDEGRELSVADLVRRFGEQSDHLAFQAV